MDRRMLLTLPDGLWLTSVYDYRIATRCSSRPGQGAASPSDDAVGEHHPVTSRSRACVVASVTAKGVCQRDGSSGRVQGLAQGARRRQKCCRDFGKLFRYHSRTSLLPLTIFGPRFPPDLDISGGKVSLSTFHPRSILPRPCKAFFDTARDFRPERERERESGLQIPSRSASGIDRVLTQGCVFASVSTAAP